MLLDAFDAAATDHDVTLGIVGDGAREGPSRTLVSV
jgi:hypothetical protein